MRSLAPINRGTNFCAACAPGCLDLAWPKICCCIAGPTSRNGAEASTTWWAGRYGKGACCMSDLKHARHLLTMANKDLAALAGMSDPAVLADEIFGFHAQQ